MSKRHVCGGKKCWCRKVWQKILHKFTVKTGFSTVLSILECYIIATYSVGESAMRSLFSTNILERWSTLVSSTTKTYSQLWLYSSYSTYAIDCITHYPLLLTIHASCYFPSETHFAQWGRRKKEHHLWCRWIICRPQGHIQKSKHKHVCVYTNSFKLAGKI